MALLLSDILEKFLAYVPTRPDGGNRDELVNLALALGMEYDQIIEALTAFLDTGVEMGSFDEPTYTSFADRYVALGERGAGMAESVAREAATRKLKLYDMNLTIAAREEQLATAVPEQIDALDQILVEVRASGISADGQAILEALLFGATRIVESGGDMLRRDIDRLTELRNRLAE